MWKHLDLFSGIGGFALAASWVWGDELEIVAFCEKDAFCQKVLKKHWPHVPIVEDIHSLNGDEYGAVDLLTGGFPCQPYSVAGKRKGKEDDRALWSEMFRVIRETRPHWVLAENVVGIISMELDTVLSDLESEDYSTQTFIIPACGINAPHRRNRVWILAHSECIRRRRWNNEDAQRQNGSLQTSGSGARKEQGILAYTDEQNFAKYNQSRRCSKQGHGTNPAWSETIRPTDGQANNDGIDGCGQVFPNTEGTKCQFARNTRKGGAGFTDCGSNDGRVMADPESWTVRNDCKDEWATNREVNTSDNASALSRRLHWWSVEPTVGRVAHGVSSRVDRLRALGNAIVPQVAEQLFRAIAQTRMEEVLHD